MQCWGTIAGNVSPAVDSLQPFVRTSFRDKSSKFILTGLLIGFFCLFRLFFALFRRWIVLPSTFPWFFVFVVVHFSHLFSLIWSKTSTRVFGFHCAVAIGFLLQFREIVYLFGRFRLNDCVCLPFRFVSWTFPL